MIVGFFSGKVKFLAFLFVLVVSAPGVFGLTCEGDLNPLISFDFTVPLLPDRWQPAESRVYWDCVSNMTDYSCLSVVHDGLMAGTPVLQVNPEPYDVEGVGRVAYFESQGHVMRPYFRAERNIMRDNVTLMWMVHCGNGSTTEQVMKQVTPRYREFDAPVTFVAQNFGNLGYWIVGMGAVVLLFLVVRYVFGVAWRWR